MHSISFHPPSDFEPTRFTTVDNATARPITSSYIVDRTIGIKGNSEVCCQNGQMLYSRTGKPQNKKLPSVVEALRGPSKARS